VGTAPDEILVPVGAPGREDIEPRVRETRAYDCTWNRHVVAASDVCRLLTPYAMLPYETIGRSSSFGNGDGHESR